MNTKAQRISLELAARDRGVTQNLSAEASRAGDSLLCALLVVYLASLLLEGVLRWFLAMAGVPNALYLRDAIPLATLAVLFLRYLLAQNRVDLTIAVPAAILAFHAAYAAMLGVGFFSIAFGLKIFMFIPYGMAMWPLVRPRFDRALTVASIMFAVTLTGVFANFLLGKMPWEGLEYDTAFGAVSTTREWWSEEGLSRLPGFARASFNAAMIVGITGLLTLLKFRHPAARLMIAACAMSAIVLTTTKGMAVAFPLAALWPILQERRPRMSGTVLVSAVCAATLAMPFLIVLFDLGFPVPRSSVPPLLLSAWDRFTDTWPLAFRLLPEGPEALMGTGVGSIGTPQLFGDAPRRFSPGDNFPVYMMITFGLPGLFYYAMPVFAARRVAAAENLPVRQAYVGLLLIAYGFGMSTNMVEESFFSVSFGLCCGVAASTWLRPVES
jgi:hypothetical protein